MAKQYGFIIDSERCVDCRACVTACKTGNKIEIGISWRHVTSTWQGTYPQVAFTSRSMACNHCADPACLKVCPVNAISKRSEDGIVVVNRTKCIGCRACGKACPYNAPQYGADGHMQKCNLCLDRVESRKRAGMRIPPALPARWLSARWKNCQSWPAKRRSGSSKERPGRPFLFPSPGRDFAGLCKAVTKRDSWRWPKAEGDVGPIHVF